MPPGATLHRTRWRETTYTAVSWDYPPSPAAYYDALLSCGASRSRFLRLAYLSTRDRSPNAASLWKPAPRLPPIPPFPPRPRSANPTSHSLKRRKPQWPKPPHYHAALLRSPLSHRKGLFRAILPPNKAVDFFRWDILRVSLSPSCQERDWTRSADVDTCASLHVAESVLAPYEAAAGFFGWHGLGLAWHDENMECCSRSFPDQCRSSDLQLEIDEAMVEEGRARWARIKEELVGPPGLALRPLVEDRKSAQVIPPDLANAPPPLLSHDEVRWNPDIGSSTLPLPRTPDAKWHSHPSSSAASASRSKLERKTDSPSAWWFGPPPHRGPHSAPHLPSLRFLPPPSVQYGPPPPHFSPWFPGNRVGSAQGHGFWYGPPPVGAPSPMTLDPNVAKSLPPHSRVFASATSTQSPRHLTKPIAVQDEYGTGDKEIETDHDYESTTTTTTDSDPPPHTPIGTATSHCEEAVQLHGDDDVELHGLEIDAERAAGSLTIRMSDPTTPVKLLDRFAVPTSPSLSSDSLDSYRDGCESSKGTVVFPSLNGSFCQGSSSQTTVVLSPGTLTPVKRVTPVGSLSSSKDPVTSDDEEDSVKIKGQGLEASVRSVSGDGPSFMPSLCSPPLTSPSRGLRKDSQGFWEPVTPVSPTLSSSSLPLSPSQGKMGSQCTTRWIGDKAGPVLGERCESPGSSSSPSTLSAMSRSMSPGPRRDASVGSTRSSSSRPASYSSPSTSPASASAFCGSHPSSPSPPDILPSNQTTLLPAFLATAAVKRKKASRTREIVDRLRSSSIDAGKGCVDNLGWLASPSEDAEEDGKPTKGAAGSDHIAGHHVAGGQPSPSQSGTDSTSWAGSDTGQKDNQAIDSRPPESGSSGSGGKSHGTTQVAVSGSEVQLSHAVLANPGITPFPILSVCQTVASNSSTPRQSLTSGAGVIPPSNGGDGAKKNTTPATSPNARCSGLQLVPTTPNGGTTSPNVRHSHHPLPSPTHPVHPPPVLGPPPPITVAVAPYPHPMYMPFTQYHVAPAHHQVQQGQGAWLAVYPSRPPHVHPLPPPPITGVSGMRHVSW